MGFLDWFKRDKKIIDYGPDWDFEWARHNWFFTMADSDIY